MGGSEAGGDRVLIQTFLLYIQEQFSITKQSRFVSKQGQPEPHIHSKARVLSPQL